MTWQKHYLDMETVRLSIIWRIHRQLRMIKQK